MTEPKYPYAYPARFEPDEGAIVVTFPDFPEAGTYGIDQAEAKAQAADCLLETVAVRMLEREDIPLPSRPRRGQVLIPLPTLAAAKVALYRTMREEGVTMAELARRMRCDMQQVRRLLNIGHGSRLDQLDAAFAALQKRLVVEVRDAA